MQRPQQDISKESKLHDLSSKNSETLEHFNDFLYWREPLEILDFEGLFPVTCNEPDIPEKLQHNVVNENVVVDDSNYKDAKKQGGNRTVRQTKTNDKVTGGKKQKGKKKQNSCRTNSATSTLNVEKNPIKSIGIYYINISHVVWL